MEHLPKGRSMIEYDDGEVEEIHPREEVMIAAGALVWAKMKGFPWWPARTWSHVGKLDQDSNDTRVIEFLGEDHTAPFSSVETMDFKSNFEKHISPLLLGPEGQKRTAHKHAPAAVQEALEAFDFPTTGKDGGELSTLNSLKLEMSQLTAMQIGKLASSYKVSKRPDDETIQRLEENTGLPRATVVAWFLHRRNNEFKPSFGGGSQGVKRPHSGGGGSKAKRARLAKADINSVDCFRCEVDNREEALVLCERCNYSIHTSCLRPPLASVPAGDWYCAKCRGDKSEGAQALVLSGAPADVPHKWPTAHSRPSNQFVRGSPDDLSGPERWTVVNYEMDEEDIVFCRKNKISPDHLEWIIDRLEKRVTD